MSGVYEMSRRGLIMVELAYDINEDKFSLYEPHSRSVFTLSEDASKLFRWTSAIITGLNGVPLE